MLVSEWQLLCAVEMTLREVVEPRLIISYRNKVESVTGVLEELRIKLRHLD